MFMIRYALSAYSTSCNFFSLSQGLVRAQLAFKEKKLLKTCYICLTGILRGIFGELWGLWCHRGTCYMNMWGKREHSKRCDRKSGQKIRRHLCLIRLDSTRCVSSGMWK